MGLDINNFLVLGAIVQDTEIFVRKERVPYKCPECTKGHEAGLKFCGECGLKFKSVYKDVWAPKVQAYLNQHRRCPEINELHASIHGSGPIYNVRSEQSSEDRDTPPVWAVGIKFEGQRPIDWGRLETARVEVTRVVLSMGLSGREVSLYPVMYVSV